MEQLDIIRTPNPQVTFGTGIHLFLGAQLACVEPQGAIEKRFT